MNIIVSQITGNLTILSGAYSADSLKEENTTVPHFWRMTGESHHKRPVMRKVFPCNDVVKSLCIISKEMVSFWDLSDL